MFLFTIRKIGKDGRALINVLRQEKNWSSQRLLRKFSGKNLAWTTVDRLLKKINFTGVTERPKGSNRPRSVRTSEYRKTSNLWRSSSAVMKMLCTSTKMRTKLYEIGRKMDISQSFVRCIAKHDLRLKIYKRLSRLL